MNILAAVACDRRAVLIAAAGDIDNDGLVLSHGRRELDRVRDSVCRLDRRDDALDTAEVLECVYRFVVRHRNVLCAADVVQVSVLRADAGIIQTGGDGVDRRDLTVLVLTEVATSCRGICRAGRSRWSRRSQRCRCRGPRPRQPIRRTALIVDEVVKAADGVRAAADTGHHGIRAVCPSFSSICSLISLEMTDWKSRTMVGNGVRPHDTSRGSSAYRRCGSSTRAWLRSTASLSVAVPESKPG